MLRTEALGRKTRAEWTSKSTRESMAQCLHHRESDEERQPEAREATGNIWKKECFRGAQLEFQQGASVLHF
jgi:hypothetical protein